VGGFIIFFKNLFLPYLGLVAHFNNSGGTADGMDAGRMELSSPTVVDDAASSSVSGLYFITSDAYHRHRNKIMRTAHWHLCVIQLYLVLQMLRINYALYTQLPKSINLMRSFFTS